MTRLLIVRHARAASSDDVRLPGPDLPLLPEGRGQALALARRLRAFSPSKVVTSDAKRAWQTGEIIATACGIDARSDVRLREIDLGVWGGLTYAAVTAANPRAAAWFADPASGAPPGGESASDAAMRTCSALRALAQSGAESIVVVGHAGALRLALARLLGMPLAAYWRLRLDCASLSTLTWTPEGPILSGLNDVSHLNTGSRQEACGRPSPARCRP